MKRRELLPSRAVGVAAEVARAELRIAGDARVAAVERRVAALQLGVLPSHPGALEIEGFEGGARAPEREEPGSDVVDEAGRSIRYRRGHAESGYAIGGSLAVARALTQRRWAGVHDSEDPGPLTRDTGWSAAHDLASGMADTFRWYRSAGWL